MGTEDGFALYLEPGDPEGSAVVQSIENGRMPPSEGPIPAADLATLKTYIAGLSAEAGLSVRKSIHPKGF